MPILPGHNAYAQTKLDSASLDFWSGQWNLSWKNPDGSTSKGVNFIEKTLDNKVIQENFKDERGFKGTSISVFNPNKKSWHQAWADNQGGYFNFIGAIDDGNFVFKTIPVEQDGKVFIQKMIYRNVTLDGFTWDWMATQDGGITWKLNWQIFYERKVKN